VVDAGHRVSVRGDFCWPFLGRSGGRPWGKLMAAYGEFRVAVVNEHKFHVPSDRYIRRLILMGLVADRFNVALSPSADYREGRLAKRGALPQKDPT
jgi:hypothetical protein